MARLKPSDRVVWGHTEIHFIIFDTLEVVLRAPQSAYQNGLPQSNSTQQALQVNTTHIFANPGN